jgi:hypothetical protein
MEPDLEPARLFVDAVASRNHARLRHALAPHVRLRALTSCGLQQSHGADAVADHVLAWFGDPDVLRLETYLIEPIGERIHLHYRFLLHDLGGWFRLEHDAFVNPAGSHLAAIDLVSSGLEPVAPPSVVVLPEVERV